MTKPSRLADDWDYGAWDLTVPADQRVAVGAPGAGFRVVFAKGTPLVEFSSYVMPSHYWFLWRMYKDGKEHRRLTLELSVDRGQLVCNSVRVAAVHPGGVTTTDLRDVPLGMMIQAAGFRAALLPAEQQDDGTVYQQAILVEDITTAEWAEKTRGGRESPRRGQRLPVEHLQDVARIYREAVARAAPPTQAVASELHTARSNAGRWVAEARRRGLLDPAPGPGQKGEIREESDDG